MPDYAALVAKWVTLPAGNSVAQNIAAINALTVSGPSIDVTPSAVSGLLLLEQAYFTFEAFAGGATTGVTTHDAALLSAKSLVALLSLPQPPVFRMSDPTTYAKVKGMLDAILAQETAAAGSTGITQQVHDDLLALAATTLPWATAPVAQGGAGLTRAINAWDACAAGLITETQAEATEAAQGAS